MQQADLASGWVSTDPFQAKDHVMASGSKFDIQEVTSVYAFRIHIVQLPVTRPSNRTTKSATLVLNIASQIIP